MLLLSHSGKEGNGGGDDDPNPQPIMQIEREEGEVILGFPLFSASLLETSTSFLLLMNLEVELSGDDRIVDDF